MKPIDYKETPEPHYYKGKIHGYTARNITEDFELTFNTGTALKYILRAGKKEGNSASQDIQKAINVLHFELDKLHRESKTQIGSLAK